ncbi:DUF4123 domain-containing protein [Pseudomonas sp. D47]|uniref:DUF4123 domain-containing protein n=1 Tax=Pseudomonas sp. D47 TaxID=3159447 RepID=UPI00387AD846
MKTNKILKRDAGMQTNVSAPSDWLSEQHAQQRELILIIDRLAELNPIAQLFTAQVMNDYISLYQESEFSDLADLGPWLVRLDPTRISAITDLLNNPQQNWGWIVSTKDCDLKQIAQHWRDRMVIVEKDQRSFYRFQDNRVIAQDLGALNEQQLPLLLGPICSALYWDEQRWLSRNNPRPADYPPPFATPWLDLPEPESQLDENRRITLENWLWEMHSDATLRQLSNSQELAPWLNMQLTQAKQWGWLSLESMQFLLEHRLNPELANHTVWDVLEGESPEKHFARCCRDFSNLFAGSR